MDKKRYKKKIKTALVTLDVYISAYDLAIDKLADILAEYDEAMQTVEADGKFVEHTNKAGATNMELSPAAITMRQCRADALAYMRELGLTAAGLKKLKVEDRKGADGLLDALRALG